MRDYSIKEFRDRIDEKLQEIGYPLIEDHPTIENKEEEIVQLQTPLKSVNKTQNAFPLLSTFQVSIICWSVMQHKCMEMTGEVDQKLQEYNMTRTITSPAMYDSTIQKYGITTTYEVRYNALMDSFDFIK